MSETSHTFAKGQAYSCSVCKKSFSELNKLTRHKKVHESEYKYKCSACEKAFAYKHTLDVHISRKHIEKKPHGCDQCEKTFATAYDLQRHIKTHTGSKPYHCESCDKWFSASGDLVRHKRIHTGEKPYKCNVCSRPFTRLGSCLRHQKTHSGGKIHKCDICNEAFTRSWNLQVHKRSHTGEKPYCCDKCTKSFSFLRELKIHKKTHVKTNNASKEINITVGNKIHSCGICGKEFKRKGNLQQHVEICQASFSKPNGIAGHSTTRSDSSMAAFNAQPSGLGPYKASSNECAMKFDGEVKADDTTCFSQALVEPDDVYDTVYVCSLCGVSFETNILLNNHITDNHE